MTQIVGNVVDVGLGGLHGTLTVWSGFRPDTNALIAPRRRQWDIEGGEIPSGVDVVPGPAVIELNMGLDAFDTIDVVIPDGPTVTIQDLYLQGHVWQPYVISQVAEDRARAEAARVAAEAAAENVDAAIGDAADQVVAAVEVDRQRAESAREGAESARDDAQGSAAAAASSADEAAGYATSAVEAEGAAESAATAAAQSRDEASGSASDADQSARDALTYRNTALGAADAASESESNAAVSESNAAQSENAAGQSASNAADSAAGASSSAAIASGAVDDVAASAVAAAQSATAAASSAIAAAASAAEADQSEANAADSATVAGEAREGAESASQYVAEHLPAIESAPGHAQDALDARLGAEEARTQAESSAADSRSSAGDSEASSVAAGEHADDAAEARDAAQVARAGAEASHVGAETARDQAESAADEAGVHAGNADDDRVLAEDAATRAGDHAVAASADATRAEDAAAVAEAMRWVIRGAWSPGQYEAGDVVVWEERAYYAGESTSNPPDQEPWIPLTPAGGGGVSHWDDLDGKPTVFPPEAHGHDAADVTGEATPLLDVTEASVGAQSVGEALDATTDASRLEGALTDQVDANEARFSLEPLFGDPTPMNLFGALVSFAGMMEGHFAGIGHSHPVSDVDGLQAALDDRPTHTEMDTALDAKVQLVTEFPSSPTPGVLYLKAD